MKSNSATVGVTLTNKRTQGSFAFAIYNPGSQTTLASQVVSSALSQLAGFGDVGAVFEIDIMPAAQPDPTAVLKLFINSPALGLSNAEVGQASLSGLIAGIYNTVQFAIPDSVRTALSRNTAQDLSFQLQLNLQPGSLPAGSAANPQFRLDNLRVHSVPLVTATSSSKKPPAGYGLTVDLVANGPTPVSQSFTTAAVQVPDSFHLTQGVAGSTTVSLGLGYDGAAAFTCTYDPDSTDTTGQSYTFNSCTGDVQAGDIVGASFAQLTIVNAAPSMQVRAQLATNPVGDLVGRGVIPAMPTYWGDAAVCTPAPQAHVAVTTTPACNSQATQIHQIVTNYFTKVHNANVAPNYVVTGIPEFAQRHGDGSPHNALQPLHIISAGNGGQASKLICPSTKMAI